ncbi:hypothetical protein [Alloprevotella tannerae]|uniref:hypothetical protein n=1 Tax=Alloprevotella tannerae TaxID=76122 RepID=UPI0028E1B2C8|nr:hypothetical protein [Alloprevotella tannerae]
MKTNILSLLALTSLLFAACATDNVEPGKQKQGQEIDTAGMTAFSSSYDMPDPTNPTTRMAGEYVGTGLRFYWTTYNKLGIEYKREFSGEKYFIADDRNDIEAQLKASGKDRTPRATFWFRGENFTASQYNLRYVGVGFGDYPYFERAKIEAEQEQTKPNDAIDISKYGDCGTGVAHKQADGNYIFKIDHKASYITFLPYTLQKGVAKAQIEKIKVTADQAVCGEFHFDSTGIILDSRPATTNYNNHIELKVNKFPIPLNAPDANVNAVIMVIAPGTYSKFTVEYTIHEPAWLGLDGGTDTRGTITKEYKNVTFTAGKNKVISQNLQVGDYSADTYYMWDAKVGEYYWKGYEWYSALPEQDPFFKGPRTHYPKDNTDPRWYREIPDGLAPGTDIEAKRSCKDCPNVNELCWYVKEGDIYYDDSLFVTMDHLYKGGHWIKKLSVIAKEQGKSVEDLKKAAPDGIDYRKKRLASPPSYSVGNHFGHRPANINDYFYLPNLGFCNYPPSGIGGDAGYWSSTPHYYWETSHPQNSGAYLLFLYGTHVDINTFSERVGCSIMWPTDR